MLNSTPGSMEFGRHSVEDSRRYRIIAEYKATPINGVASLFLIMLISTRAKLEPMD